MVHVVPTLEKLRVKPEHLQSLDGAVFLKHLSPTIYAFSTGNSSIESLAAIPEGVVDVGDGCF